MTDHDYDAEAKELQYFVADGDEYRSDGWLPIAAALRAAEQRGIRRARDAVAAEQLECAASGYATEGDSGYAHGVRDCVRAIDDLLSEESDDE